MRTRELRIAAAIGIVVGAALAFVGGFGNRSPVSIATIFLTTYWFVGLILLVAAVLLGERWSGSLFPRVLGVVSAAWVGFVVGVALIFLFIAFMLSGRGV